MAIQGKDLMDKFYHPKYQLTEEKRQKMAKWYTLLLQAGLSKRPDAAMAQLEKEFPGSISKTAIGDTGNTFPIPDIVEEEIINFMREKSVVLQNGRIWPMTSEIHSFPVESTAVSVAWGNETQESEPVITEVELTAKELSAYSVIKNSHLQDARSDIVSWLNDCLVEAAALELDNVAFNGDGTSTYASCSGLMTAACGLSVVMADGYTNFSSMTGVDLSNMIAQLDGLRKEGAKFFMHGSILHYVRTLTDSNNKPIFMETYGSGVPNSIFGYPYQECIKMPETSAANTAFALFGNMKYFGVGRRLDSSTLTVDPYGLFTTNRTRFKLYQRWGLGILLSTAFVRLVTASS